MEVGGSQTHLLQVLRLLDRTRFAPRLYCLTGRGPLLGAAREAGAPVDDGGMSAFRPVPMLQGVVKLARFLRRERIDVVHNYLLRANIVGTLAARLAGVPVVLVSKRGCHERRGLELFGARLSNRLAGCVTTNAEAVREFVASNESCRKEKMVVIPSGIDTQRFQPLPAGDYKSPLGLDPAAPVVGIVTRMRVRKGVEEFLRAMAMVRKRRPDVQTVVVGEVGLAPELERLVAECGLSSSLKLLGRRQDMPQVLSAFDVFVLSSHDEGMSNAILEAMAMRLPVVATDVGGTGEVVRQGETGWLVPARDPVPLADAISSLLAEPEARRAMGGCGRKSVVDRFSSQAMVHQMEALYVRLLERKPRGLPRAAPSESAS